MRVNFQSLITAIKSVKNANIANDLILNGFFDGIIDNYDLKNKKGDRLEGYNHVRASEVINSKVPVYSEITGVVKDANALNCIIESMDGFFKNTFRKVNIEELNEALKKYIARDETFGKKEKERINQLPNNSKQILAECIYYCLQIDDIKNQFRRNKNYTNVANVVPDVDINEVGQIIYAIVKNKKNKKKNIKHIKAYSLADKLKRNEITGILYTKVVDFGEEYDCVIEAIDNLSEIDINIPSKLYGIYEDVYNKVLSEMSINIGDIESIQSASEGIFDKIDKYIFDNYLLGENFGISNDRVRSNLFAITVAVFYKCKFLLPLEEENDSN